MASIVLSGGRFVQDTGADYACGEGYAADDFQGMGAPWVGGQFDRPVIQCLFSFPFSQGSDQYQGALSRFLYTIQCFDGKS